MPSKTTKPTKRPVKQGRKLAETSRETAVGSKRRQPSGKRKRKLTRAERSQLNRFTWQQRWIWLAAWRQRIYARLADKGLVPVTETGQIMWKPGKQPAFSIPNKDVDALNAAWMAQRAAKKAAERASKRAP